MASIDRRVGSDGKVTWRVRIRQRGFPTRTKSFNRKTDATAWAKTIEGDLTSGRHVPTQEAMRRTLADAIDRYLEHTLPNKPRNRDKKKVEALLGWWRDELGSYALANLTPAAIVEARDKLSNGKTNRGSKRSPATVNRYLAALSHVLKTACREWHWIQVSPMSQVSRREEPQGRVRFLSDDERKALLQACRESRNPDLYTLVVLALSTGARSGELRNLTWRDVDTTRKVITLHETKNKDRRVLPLYGPALELLEARKKVRRIDTALVFPGRKKGRPADFREAFESAVARAGLEDFRFHDLRHTAASYLAMNGATLAEIAAVLGHRTLAMVKRYSHLSEQHTAAVVERMNAKVFGDEA